MDIEIIKSRRKTAAIQVYPDGHIKVRVPNQMRKSEIDAFIQDNDAWIRKNILKMQKRQEERANAPAVEQLSIQEIRELADQAARVLPEKARKYAREIGVTYGRITIRNQKTKWGSCSSKGNLNFNCLLMLAPEEVQDYVVVHELCHRKEMNHSPRFWAEVERVLPDYKIQVKWLKEHGEDIMRRMLGSG